jgi:hypothetical protein
MTTTKLAEQLATELFHEPCLREHDGSEHARDACDNLYEEVTMHRLEPR